MSNSQSLRGRQILVTRALAQSEKLCAWLSSEGATPHLFPCIDVECITQDSRIVPALKKLAAGSFDWLVFISQNAVAAFAAAADIKQVPKTTKIVAIGNRTARALEDLGMIVHLIPNQFSQRCLVNLFLPRSPYPPCQGRGKHVRVLLPLGNLNDGTLGSKLSQIGLQVSEVEVYKTVMGSGGVEVMTLLEKNALDAITFYSPSAVHNFLKRLQMAGGHLRMAVKVPIACVGPFTAAAASEAGLSVKIVAKVHNTEGLCQAIKEFFT